MSWLSDLLFEGNVITAKFTSRGKVFAFQSVIVGRFIKNNISLILLNYPNDLEMYDARNYPRIKCFVPADAIIGKEVCASLILDVSSGGCLLGLANPPETLVLSIDDSVSVVSAVLGMEGKQTFECNVTNVRKKNQVVEMGVRFDGPGPDLRALLENYINDVSRLLSQLGLE